MKNGGTCTDKTRKVHLPWYVKHRKTLVEEMNRITKTPNEYNNVQSREARKTLVYTRTYLEEPKQIREWTPTRKLNKGEKPIVPITTILVGTYSKTHLY